MNSKWVHVIFIVLIVAVCFLIFYKTSGFDFAVDDWRLIYEKRDFLQDWSNLKVAFTQPFPAETYEPIPYYRPVVTLVNFVNHHLLGKTTFGYHIVNLGFHILNAVLLYLLVFLLFKREFLSLMAALFFAAHPIHTNSVVWISARTDLIACLFVLVSLILFFKRKDHSGTPRLLLFWGAVLAYLFALLSKEMALALPLFLFVWDYVSERESIGKKIVPYVPFLAVSVLYLVLRVAILGNLGAGEAHTSANLFGRFLTAFAIYFYYFKKFLFPFYLTFSPQVLTITTMLSLKFWGALISFAVVLGLGFSLRRSSREASFGIFWILVMLVPVLNLVPLYASVKEWWAYIPSVGFCLILGRVAEAAVGWERKLLEIRLPRRKPKEEKLPETQLSAEEKVPPEEEAAQAETAAGDLFPVEQETPEIKSPRLPERIVIRAGHAFSLFFVVVLLFYAFTIQSRARVFRKDYFLWSNTSRIAPHDATAHRVFGDILQRKGAARWAKVAYQKAVQADPQSAEARNKFGIMLEITQQDDSAMVQIKEALRLEPEFVDAYNNLGILYGKKQDYDSALVAFKRAAELDSTFYQAWKNVGLIYSDQENYPQALRYLDKALQTAPNPREAEAIQDMIDQIRVEGWDY
jgi:tetratricopeptide (TPR) repeat protein